MAFSFSPGQIAPEGSQAAAPGTVAPGATAVPVSGPPSDSPFLFIRERGQPLSVMASVQIVLVVVAILSVVICGIMYAYSVYLGYQITSNQEEIQTRDAEFKEYPFDDMRRLSLRMATLDKLLQSYMSPRSPLKFLENVVENQVVFDSFMLSADFTGAYTARFKAKTNDYKTLIQQLAALDLQEYKKVAPSQKLSGLLASKAVIEIEVATPIFVQGKLPDEIVFFTEQSKSTPNASPTQATSSVLDSSKP